MSEGKMMWALVKEKADVGLTLKQVAGPGMRQKRREDQNPQDVDLRARTCIFITGTKWAR